MADKDDILLRDFLSAGREAIPDEGFSHRVVRQLPREVRRRRLEKMCTVCCFVAMVVLIAVFYHHLLSVLASDDLFFSAMDNFVEAVFRIDDHLRNIGGLNLSMGLAVLILLSYNRLARLTD